MKCLIIAYVLVCLSGCSKNTGDYKSWEKGFKDGLKAGREECYAKWKPKEPNE